MTSISIILIFLQILLEPVRGYLQYGLGLVWYALLDPLPNSFKIIWSYNNIMF